MVRHGHTPSPVNLTSTACSRCCGANVRSARCSSSFPSTALYAKNWPTPAARRGSRPRGWGFKTQTLLSPQQLRHLVFPWHAQIVTAAHAVGKPAILHSCGKPDAIMDDIIDGLHYDAKHSFEDSIIPVEDAYERWGRRIAILGGMDVDFVARSSPEGVRERARAMLRRTADRGGYALGTGNSVPECISATQWAAMAGAALESARAEEK